MRNAKTRTVVAAVVGGFLLFSMVAMARKPNFSGTWVLDEERSDNLEEKVRIGAGETNQIARLDVKRIVDRLTHLARASDEIEIEQSAEDFTVADKEDNLRIYYIDGKKHVRQTPWGARLQTLTNWKGTQLIITTDSKELGKVTETYRMEGEQLVFIVQFESDDFENTVVARNQYFRKKGQ